MAEDIGKTIEAMERSGLVERLSGKAPTRQKCMVCGRETPILEAYTGEARQRMCEECRRTYYDLAKIMCRKCGKFLGFMRTGISETGYHVKRDETLHTPWCDNCDPESARKGPAPIEEIERFSVLRRENEMAGAIEGHHGRI
jgi:hypothetical protein